MSMKFVEVFHTNAKYKYDEIKLQQTNKQANKQTNKQTDRQTGRQTHR